VRKFGTHVAQPDGTVLTPQSLQQIVDDPGTGPVQLVNVRALDG